MIGSLTSSPRRTPDLETIKAQGYTHTQSGPRTTNPSEYSNGFSGHRPSHISALPGPSGVLAGLPCKFAITLTALSAVGRRL